MKNSFFSVPVIILLLLSFMLTANAAYYYDDGSNDDNPNIDKFVPSSGVKIKESGLARMMENATKDAVYSSKEEKNAKKAEKKQQQSEQNYDNENKRSYKWF